MGLTHDPNFNKLQDWYTAHALNINLRHMFETDKERFNKLRYSFLPKQFKADLVPVKFKNGSCDHTF